MPRCLRYLLVNVALLGGCAATRPVVPVAPPAPPAAVAAVAEHAPAAAPSAVGMVRCSASDFTASVSGSTDSFPDIDDWPLDGSDTAPGSDKDNPVMRCGPADSYAFVASVYRCPDGANPFAGNRDAGRGARRGNVGSNRHHNGIIDLYIVPCASGNQDVFVNMYGCPDAPARKLSGKGLALRESLPAEAAALMEEALKLNEEKHFQEAVARAKQALAVTTSKLGAQHPHNATLYDLLGALYLRTGERAQAEQAWAAAYQLWQEAEWPPTQLVGNTLLGLAMAYSARKPLDGSICLSQHAISHLEDVKGPYDRRIVHALMLLAAAYNEQGQTKLAEKMYKRAVRLTELHMGRRHPDTLAAVDELMAFYGTHDDKTSLALLHKRVAATR